MKSARLLWVAAAALLLTGGVVVPGGGSAGARGTGGPRCGGLTPMKSSGTPWVCTFDDEFNGTSLDRTNWKVDLSSANGFHTGAACAVDNPQTVSVSNGFLNLRVHRTFVPFVCRTPKDSFTTGWREGSVHTSPFAQAYGLIAVRAKFPEANGVAGLQSAIWTYPSAMTLHKALAGTTELDIAEAYSRWPDLVMATVHRSLAGTTKSCDMPDYGARFHTYAMEWTKRRAKFFYDGVKCYSAGRTGTSQPFFVALTQGLGIRRNVDSPATPSPALMQVDWVRVWK